ncbi:MAG: hypothetical protein CVU06_15365 [Bacteroidetes bacterium HGW-Bacteroidetes-22]|nr:MAG: hypothetical protein CVU06_15365 [Bacteroidetes bacterium HGW-Bacteroidetes-22]
MEIRPYKSGDESGILELFKKSFRKPLDIKFWKWRYLSSPTHKEPMISLMVDNDTIIGHYAVSPVVMNFMGDKVLAGLSMTTMTHPDYGGRGIFPMLAKDLYTRIKDQYHVRMVWGFPNLNSNYSFITKLGWRDVGVQHMLSLAPQDHERIPRANYKLIESFSEVHSSKLNGSGTDTISVSKSPAYLNWRYIENPANKYYILNIDGFDSTDFVVIKIYNSFKFKGKQEIDILELGVGNDPNSVSTLVGAIFSFIDVNDLAIVSVNLWLSLTDPRHRYFEKLRFTMDSPLTILAYRLFTENNDALDNCKTWRISLGDSDVY